MEVGLGPAGAVADAAGAVLLAVGGAAVALGKKVGLAGTRVTRVTLGAGSGVALGGAVGAAGAPQAANTKTNSSGHSRRRPRIPNDIALEYYPIFMGLGAGQARPDLPGPDPKGLADL